MSEVKGAKKIVNRTRTEVIKRWVKALRSGEYKQTQDTLRDSTGFCCLGVLCDLAAKDGGAQWRESDNDGGFSYNGKFSVPPTPIQNFVFAGNSGFMGKVMDMNDLGNKSFKQIANAIEKELK